MGKFRIKRLKEATYEMDNLTDTDRKYAISADVKVIGKSVQNIQSGIVTGLEGEAPQPLADFNDHGNLSSNIYNTAQTSADRTEVFTAISEFCTRLRTDGVDNAN